MSWKKTLVSALGAGSVLIRIGISFFLGIVFLIAGFLTFLYTSGVSGETEQAKQIQQGFGGVVCVPITLIILLVLMISVVWTFSGIRTYLLDVEREEKKKTQ